MHVNFKITQTKASEAIVFADPSGNIIDFHLIDIPTQMNHSWARTTDGTGTWGISTDPTPNGSNDANDIHTAYAATPMLDLNAGLYPGAIDVTITSPEAGVTIYYTTNGNTPTLAASVYSAPIHLTETTVLRAVAVSSDPNILPSYIESNTYFINADHTVRIVSITGQQVADLLDGDGWGATPRGSFELFDADFNLIDEGAGEYNKHGNNSWAYQQRGFRLH